MTLNASGPISLAGTTAGVSIEIENGGTGTSQISLNDTAVRNLAGIASGAISMPSNFYGKSNASYFLSNVTAPTDSYFLTGGSNDGLGQNTVVDNAKNYYRIGPYSVSSPNYYSYIIKRDKTGALVWAKTYGSFANSAMTCVMCLSNDNNFIYMLGSTGVVIKINTSDGSIVWQRLYSQTFYYYYCIAPSNAGGCIIAGSGYISSLNQSAAITIINSDGTLSNAYSYQPTTTNQFVSVASLAQDSSNNIYFNGRWGGLISYVAKINSSGTLQWVNGYTAAATNAGMYSIKLDSTQSNIFFSGILGKASSINDCIYGSIASNGSLNWASTLVGVSNQDNTRCTIAVDSSNNVYLETNKVFSSTNNLLMVKTNSSGAFQYCTTIAPSVNINFSFAGYGHIQLAGAQAMLGSAYSSNGRPPWTASIKTDTSSTGSYSLNSITYTLASPSAATVGISSSAYSYFALSFNTVTAATVTITTPSYTMTDFAPSLTTVRVSI